MGEYTKQLLELAKERDPETYNSLLMQHQQFKNRCRNTLDKYIRAADIAAQDIVSKLECRDSIVLDNMAEQFVTYNINDCRIQQQLQKPYPVWLSLFNRIKTFLKNLFTCER